jgi:RHS repeat-associated protein
VKKTTSTSTTRFVYDEAGRLAGEYADDGTLVEETVWLADLPVATLRPNGTGIDIYYVHADQLGTPRLVTRPSDNQVGWRWDNAEPFGNSAPDQNPSGLGTFAYNLRFPGQYFDAETGTSYNMMRDYDARLGRYIESDPIGLRGGLNTYAYVDGRPLTLVDNEGLAVAAAAVPLLGGGGGAAGLGALGTAGAAVAAGGALGWGIGSAINWGFGAATGTSIGSALYDACQGSKDDRKRCEAEIAACIKTCMRARSDPNQRKVWGGSWWRCMTGCVPKTCQDYIDENQHGDPLKKYGKTWKTRLRRFKATPMLG